MNEELKQELQERIALHGFLGSVFLTLPDKEFVDSLLSREWDQTESEGVNLIGAYATAMKDADVEEILLDLGRDRARLIRGANNEGMPGAYESLFSDFKANEALGSLNRFYADTGFELNPDVHDSGDALGVEISFAQTLMEKELAALEEGDEESAAQWAEVRDHFHEQHLGRWAYKYADSMEHFARTDFYRGIAHLIRESV